MITLNSSPHVRVICWLLELRKNWLLFWSYLREFHIFVRQKKIVNILRQFDLYEIYPCILKKNKSRIRYLAIPFHLTCMKLQVCYPGHVWRVSPVFTLKRSWPSLLQVPVSNTGFKCISFSSATNHRFNILALLTRLHWATCDLYKGNSSIHAIPLMTLFRYKTM